MHISSHNLMNSFVREFLSKNKKVLDFGGTHINGSYKDIIIKNQCSYETLDWNNSDYVVNGYDWSNVPKNHFDAIISGQAFEHDSYFWKTLSNMKMIVKRGGLVMIIVPSKGGFHQHPRDCYRFYPDSALVFAELLEGDVLKVVWNNAWAIKSKGRRINTIFEYEHDNNFGDLGIVIKIK